MCIYRSSLRPYCPSLPWKWLLFLPQTLDTFWLRLASVCLFWLVSFSSAALSSSKVAWISLNVLTSQANYTSAVHLAKPIDESSKWQTSDVFAFCSDASLWIHSSSCIHTWTDAQSYSDQRWLWFSMWWDLSTTLVMMGSHSGNLSLMYLKFWKSLFELPFTWSELMCKEKNMTTWVRKYSVFYIKLFKSTIVTRYSNMSQKDIQETISQLPAGSILPVVVS